MSHQPYSRADRNRVRRGLRSDRPVNAKAWAAWSTSVMRNENPGARYWPLADQLKLVYPASAIKSMWRYPRRAGKTETACRWFAAVVKGEGS